MKKIFVAGSINTDFIIQTPRMPEAGETLAGSGFTSAHGGKGANQAVASARLGGDTRFCACVGDDTFGKEAKKALASDGIDISHVRTVGSVPSGTAVIVLTGGDNRIIIDKGANGKVGNDDIDSFLAEANAGDIFLAQLEIPLDTVSYALEKADEREMFVILNPAPADKAIGEALRHCDLVITNETETELFGGREEILSKSKGGLIVTLGSKGFEICSGEGAGKYPCSKVKAVDTTAAGDTFCGGICARLAAGDTLPQAASFASAAASLACTKIGAQPSIPSAEQTREFMKK